jgi:hypothetical protein
MYHGPLRSWWHFRVVRNFNEEVPPSTFMNFARTLCQSMSCSTRKVNCPHIKTVPRVV